MTKRKHDRGMRRVMSPHASLCQTHVGCQAHVGLPYTRRRCFLSTERTISGHPSFLEVRMCLCGQGVQLWVQISEGHSGDWFSERPGG